MIIFSPKNFESKTFGKKNLNNFSFLVLISVEASKIEKFWDRTVVPFVAPMEQHLLDINA
jgi:hypothetical protein